MGLGVIRPMPRSLALLAFFASLAPAAASAHIAVEPLREVLREASPDLRACAERHRLDDGRFAVRLVVDLATGKVEEVEVTDAPAELTPAAESCLEAAFTHLAFPSIGPVRSREPGTISDGQRRSRVPAAPHAGPSNRSAIVQIMWPFVLRSS